MPSCTICRLFKEQSEFRRDSSRPSTRVCNDCHAERVAARKARCVSESTGKPSAVCHACSKMMEIYGFSRDEDGGLTDICRSCAGKNARVDVLTADDIDALSMRPGTRGECVNGPRPCPWVGCKYHLWLNVGKRGHVTYRPGSEGDDSCALDVADRGGVDGAGFARSMGISRARGDQIYQGALKKVANSELRDSIGEPEVKR